MLLVLVQIPKNKVQVVLDEFFHQTPDSEIEYVLLNFCLKHNNAKCPWQQGRNFNFKCSVHIHFCHKKTQSGYLVSISIRIPPVVQ